MNCISEKKLRALAKTIKLLILDVDGVLTDGGILFDSRGTELKQFHVRDGHGIKMLLKKGIRVALITGRDSQIVSKRAKELGIEKRDVFQKSFDKKKAYHTLARRYSLRGSEIAYMGDDIVDIPVLTLCGFPVTVADADDEVKKSAVLVTRASGGRGAVREVCDLFLKAKGLWQDILDEYTQA